jgi:hypothetical protein
MQRRDLKAQAREVAATVGVVSGVPHVPKRSDEPEDDPEDEKLEREQDSGEPLMDLEDLGLMKPKKRCTSTTASGGKRPTTSLKEEVGVVNAQKQAEEQEDGDDDGDEEDDEDDEEELQSHDSTPREMLTPSLRQALTKQGYRLLGSHSGVKMCRWTKAMLRGRGGCYKHTFYGIQSYQCMEMTPSLACANVGRIEQQEKGMYDTDRFVFFCFFFSN